MNTYSSFVIKRTGVIKGFLSKVSGSKVMVGLSSLVSHLKYIGFRSKELDEKGFFDKNSDNADYRKFIKRIEENKALRHSACIKAHKLMFALHENDYKAYIRSNRDFKDIVRKTLEIYEKEKGFKLDWIANIHNANIKNPHCHVVIKGDRGYTRIRFKGEDFKRMREIYRSVFENDVKYNLRERFELSVIKNKSVLSRGVEDFSRAFSMNVKKEHKINEFEKKLQQRREAKIRELEEQRSKQKER